MGAEDALPLSLLVLVGIVAVVLFIPLGWLFALGLLAYGYPVAAFWTFVAWLVCVVALVAIP